MFVGESLKNLRILYGFTQRSLAEETGISELDIWQYGNDYKQPCLEQVNTLKRLFNVRSMYFYKPDIVSGQPNNININHISFRFIND